MKKSWALICPRVCTISIYQGAGHPTHISQPAAGRWQSGVRVCSVSRRSAYRPYPTLSMPQPQARPNASPLTLNFPHPPDHPPTLYLPNAPSPFVRLQWISIAGWFLVMSWTLLLLLFGGAGLGKNHLHQDGFLTFGNGQRACSTTEFLQFCTCLRCDVFPTFFQLLFRGQFYFFPIFFQLLGFAKKS